jgi:hypothetical protein
MQPRQRRFVNAYCADPDQDIKKAAILAGYAETEAHNYGLKLLKVPEIAEAIADQLDAIEFSSTVTVEKILREWQAIAFADCNDIVELRRECCRHCYGAGHAYQWTEAEYLAAVNRALDMEKTPPDGMGGFGYDQNKPPVEGCPECGGHGWERAHIHDTRRLKGRAKRLYAGIQKTKDGFKVNFRDQEKALDNLAKYFNMLVERKELSGPGGGAIPIAAISAQDLTDDQLAAFIKNNGVNN